MRMLVKPARAGLLVLDPVTYRPLPADGAEVPRTSYWLRRLRDGDVVPVAAESEPPATTPAPRRTASSSRE